MLRLRKYIVLCQQRIRTRIPAVRRSRLGHNSRYATSRSTADTWDQGETRTHGHHCDGEPGLLPAESQPRGVDVAPATRAL